MGTNATAIEVDTLAPTGSALIKLATDTGSSATDNLTNNGLVNVSGLENGASWQYSVDSGNNWITPSTGATSFTLEAGVYAANTLKVRQVDAAGNVQIANLGTNATTIEVDTLAPTGSALIK